MKKVTTYLAGLLLVLLSVSVFGQVNTPAGATWPFGSRIQQFPTSPYPYGLIPSASVLSTFPYNPATNQYGKSQDAYDAYVEWRSCYAYPCGSGAPVNHWRIRFDNSSQTVSEGIGYGMLLAAYAADKTLFDGLWAYYRARVNTPNGLMNWQINDGSATGCGTTPTAGGSNGATDSELDVAMALIVAECQWPTATSPYDYLTQAQQHIVRMHKEVSTCAAPELNQLSNGDGWIAGCPTSNASTQCRNPSYQAPAYVRFFTTYDNTPAGYWTNVYNTIYPMLNTNRNTTTGLVSNWCAPNGTPNTCAAPAFADHGYDAIRHPWRMATDYIWWGEAQARTNFCQPISTWIYGKTTNLSAPGNLRGPVAYDGTNNGRTLAGQDAIFTSMWGAATMGVNAGGNNQATLDFMYGRVKNVKNSLNCGAGSNSGYYGNTLRVISLFMMTGNFWKPCDQPCAGPTFASDSVSVCGSATVVLDGGIAAGAGKTFQWYRNNAVVTGATSPTLSVSATTPVGFVPPGWFRLQLNDNGCIRKDSIYVKTTAAYPQLGANLKLCFGSSVTLDPKIVGSGYTFAWDYSSTNFAGLAPIPGGTGSTLTDVRSPGLYRVTVSKTGCATVSDTITVKSSQISPVDNCTMTAPGSVVLSVTGPNLGAASLYDWYSAPTGGSPMTTGTPNPATGTLNWTTPSLSAGTYTYYVKDKSIQYGKLGRTAPTMPPGQTCSSANLVIPADLVSAGWSSNPVLQYMQSFTVSKTMNFDSVTVYFCLYNPDMPDLTFQLMDVSNTTVIATSPVRLPVRMVNPMPNVYGPPYDALIKGCRYYVGFNNVAPGQYKIKISVATYHVTPLPGAANILVEQSPLIQYNYYDDLDGVTVTMTNSYAISGSTTYSSRYAHFYDWTVSTANNCDRIPVKAYIGSCPAGLPVDLADFTGKSYASFNRLNWTTLSEMNAHYFAVERSYLGQDFEVVGKIEAKGISGQITDYVFNDYDVSETGAYYRLAQYDLDGEKHYSHVIYLSRYESEKVTVYPNPANTTVTIKAIDATEFSSVSISDLMGKELLSSSDAAIEKQLDISGLSSGVYLVSVKFRGSTEIIRLIKN
jgi:endo-1,4-beta-D-glucanase Y